LGGKGVVPMIVRFGSIFTDERPLTAKQKRGRSPLDQPSLGEAGDVAAGDDQRLLGEVEPILI
jgi:hypothetical protein